MANKIKGVEADDFIKRLFPKIRIVKDENFLKISKNVDHRIIEVDDFSLEDKLNVLLSLIQNAAEENFIIFCSKNEQIKAISNFLNEREVTALAFSSELSDQEKIESLFKFRSKNFVAFVCSDSANRGIHFDFDCHIIQFDSANNAINLLHRFGRTGRLGRKGNVTSFITKQDYRLLSCFQDLMDNSREIKPAINRKRSFAKKDS